ncbi:DNA repair photolyase [Catenuloplanes nepalensis]|uniref:DNA repair photolyase n=1 Tax=Catenuloplanes nepalensis TaxID=587533 RepID=A0ABT9N309_9ACTN|nr:Rv2578c family radical SAM protein [Catenuloplanes nepalensis]MDP9797940.1 DNA repair photolyase [Catenuloplanes nepalensis]
MRWANLSAPPDDGFPREPSPGAAPAAPPLPLALPSAVVRTFDTPGFAGMTFYEIHAKSIINRVPGASHVPFEWTINPYRGCSHACTYCFARNTHTYLDLDAGRDFDTRVVVKVNAGELVRRELAARKWRGEHIAMGTNVDCYQRAEGRYRLMPEIITALRDFANPFSILTKGTLILRDLPLLREAASVTRVGVSMSVGFVDEGVWRSAEPGAPSPRRRLDAVAALTDAGFAVSVLMAPILPGLTDTAASIDETVAAIARSGAVSVTPLPLHLRPGAREWYARWIGRHHPHLVPRYRELYRAGSYAPRAYQREVAALVRTAARRHGLDGAAPGTARAVPAPPGTPEPEQLTLL